MHRTALLASLALLSATACQSDFKLNNEGDGDGEIPPGAEPEIEVSPGTIVFDDINVTEGGTLTQPITISNVGEGNLNISDVTLSDADAPYSLGLLGSYLVEPGGYTQISVSFAPETAGDTEVTVFIDSNDIDEPTSEVYLSGLGIAPVIEVTPEVYDFGEPWVGCDALTEISISNIGNATLVVEGFEYSTGSVDLDFDPYGETEVLGKDGKTYLQYENGELPWSMAPEDDPYKVWVSYYPLDEVQDIGYLKVNSNDPLFPVVQATQEGSAVIYGYNTDVYEQPLNGPVDILFAVDKSGSMDDDIENVRQNFQLFAETLGSLDSDYHVAVVTDDSGCFAGSVNYIDKEMSTSAQQAAFDDMISGPYGTYTEAPFQLMQNALAQVGTGACNEGFYRDHATLSLVSVSDEHEQSPNSYEFYVDTFRSLKADDDDVIMHAIAGDMPSGCGGNEPGTGHYEATLETGGVFLSICATDFGSHLQAIAEGSVSENRSFELTQEPVPETIEVDVNGVPTTDGWEYSGYDEGNRVQFNNNSIPEPGSTIEITYVIKPDCSL